MLLLRWLKSTVATLSVLLIPFRIDLRVETPFFRKYIRQIAVREVFPGRGVLRIGISGRSLTSARAHHEEIPRRRAS